MTRQGAEVKPGHIVTRAERTLAVTDWLLAAAHDRHRADAEWRDLGVTLLRCGGIFSVVGIPADIVHGAAGTAEPDTVDAFLHQALHGGPVFVGASWRHYYALAPASTARYWQGRGVACHGIGACIGVPRPGRLRGDVRPGSPGWCVEMDHPGALCEPKAVAHLIAVCRARTGDGE